MVALDVVRSLLLTFLYRKRCEVPRTLRLPLKLLAFQLRGVRGFHLRLHVNRVEIEGRTSL